MFLGISLKKLKKSNYHKKLINPWKTTKIIKYSVNVKRNMMQQKLKCLFSKHRLLFKIGYSLNALFAHNLQHFAVNIHRKAFSIKNN